MAAFPIFRKLDVRNYGMYPGINKTHVLTVDFRPGLTLALGANGLGKSTLIAILFRSLTGPFDLGLPSGSIGTTELKAESQNRHIRSAFAARVNDGAAHATARLEFSLGEQHCAVTRSLKDLSLIAFERNGLQSTNEDDYQRWIVAAAGVATFGEWILVLRTIVFFFEERRTLIWDPSAQRQLLRCLLLSPEQARQWSDLEREILALDTRMRNSQSVLRREQREVIQTEQRVQAQPGVTAALQAAEAAASHAAERQQYLAERVEVADRSRHRDRLDAYRAQANHDAAMQELERARLASVESKYPTADASMRYIFSRLMSDGDCLVCGNAGKEHKRADLVAAIDANRCIVCDSELGQESESTVDLSDERIDALRSKVASNHEAMVATKAALSNSSAEYNASSKELAECAMELSSLRDKIDALANQLPPGEQKARAQHEELKGLQARVDSLRAMIKEKREVFTAEMVNHREAILRFANGIKTAFEAAAHGFLFEDSMLSWSPVREYIGQAGADGAEPTEYPAFSVELGGSDFDNVVRRDGPDQVSESQREFIDLAFRMALIHVASATQSGTIIVDAPESSLDAVFVDRAAAVLARFANSNTENRLFVTSNLGAGELVSTLLITAESTPSNRAARIVDLFKEGVPTRAIKQHESQYEMYRAQLYERISQANAT